MVKNPPAKQETRGQSLGQEDLLEREMATHSQHSCLGNPMDRGTWWATVHGVAESPKTTKTVADLQCCANLCYTAK